MNTLKLCLWRSNRNRVIIVSLGCIVDWMPNFLEASEAITPTSSQQIKLNLTVQRNKNLTNQIMIHWKKFSQAWLLRELVKQYRHTRDHEQFCVYQHSCCSFHNADFKSAFDVHLLYKGRITTHLDSAPRVIGVCARRKWPILSQGADAYLEW